MMLIFLAGLQGVPQDLYEAAAIDGADAWQRFWNVTLPMISPTIFFNLVLGMHRRAPGRSATPFVATSGGPAYATWLYALHIYATGFQFSEHGLRLGAGLVIFFVILLDPDLRPVPARRSAGSTTPAR